MQDILALYRQHRIERKERAFAKWQASGYRDKTAWDDFVAAFIDVMCLNAKRNN